MRYVIAAAILLRLGVFLLTGGHVDEGDPANYLRLAQDMSIIDRWYGSMSATYPPLYPLLLGAFGTNLLAVTLLNTALDLGTAFAIRLVDKRAAALFLLFPTMILSAAVPQKETLAMFLVAWLIVIYLSKPFYWLPYGILSGLLALTQPALAPFPLILGLTLQEPRKKLALYGAGAGMAALIVISPWAARNWILHQQFIPLTVGAGLALYVKMFGHGPLPADVLAMPEIERMRFLGSQAFQAIIADPLRYLWAVLADAFTGIFRESLAVRRLGEHSPILLIRLTEIIHLAALWLAVRGYLKSNTLKRVTLAVLLTIGLGIWLEFDERHRYFAYPLMMILVMRGLPTRWSAALPFTSPRSAP